MTKDERARAEILQAAETVFQRWGLTKTTMEDIARQAGKGKSTLYYYFKSKDAVLDAMAEDQIDRILALAQAGMAAQETARDRFFAYIATIFRELRRVMEPLNVQRDMGAVRALVGRLVEMFDAKNKKALEPILRAGLERGEFRSIGPKDVKATAHAIAVVIRGLTFDLFIDNRDERVIDLIIRMLSDGL